MASGAGRPEVTKAVDAAALAKRCCRQPWNSWRPVLPALGQAAVAGLDGGAKGARGGGGHDSGRFKHTECVPCCFRSARKP